MTIANKLTISRVVLSPVFVLVFIWGYMYDSFMARVICFVIASTFEVTDFLDGYLARKRREVSDMGKLLDPYADSMSRFTVLLCLSWAGYAYLWMIAVIFYRDITVANIRMAALRQGKVLGARLSGKVKAIVQGAGMLTILGGRIIADILEKTGVEHPIPFDIIFKSLMGIITLVTVVSAVDYIQGNWEILKKVEEQ